MGSWAEGCMISNLEIAAGEKIVICYIKKNQYEDLNSGAFGLYQPVTPLLRGTYDDYGGCDVADTPENKSIFLKVWGKLNGDVSDPAAHQTAPFGDQQTPEGCAFWMAREDAFDMLRTLRHEYVWEGSKRVGDSEKRNFTKLVAGFAKIRDPDENFMIEMWDHPRPGRDDPARKNHMRVYSLATSLLEGAANFQVPVVQTLLQLVLDNREDDALHASIAKQIAEIQMLARGLSELRKALTPLFRTGPQYDGWLAMEDFHKYLGQRIRERKTKRTEDARELKEMMRVYNLALEAFEAEHGRKPDITKNELSPYIVAVKEAEAKPKPDPWLEGIANRNSSD
jgi:hypothetical protein